MIISHVKFNRAEISNFNIKEPVVINLHFSDGSDKLMKFTVPLDNVESEAHRIVLAVRKQIKAMNQDPLDNSDDPLDNFVNVVIEDEERVEEKLKVFLGKILEKASGIFNKDAYWISGHNKSP